MPKTRPVSSVLEPLVEMIGEDFSQPKKQRAALRNASTIDRVEQAQEAVGDAHTTLSDQRLEGEMKGAPSPPITVIIPASAEYVLVVRLAVTGVASRMAFAYDQVEDIKLAVTEACNNAILHAIPSGAENFATSRTLPLVTVQMTPYPDHLEVRVIDEGRVPPPGLPLRPSRAAKSQSTLEDSDVPDSDVAGREAFQELAEGGLGLLFIQTLMDEVSLHTSATDRTEVRMIKLLPR